MVSLEFRKIKQKLYKAEIGDLKTEIAKQLEEAGLRKRLRPGMSVAVTAGSRGIHRIPEILSEVCGFIKACGGNPFLVPAMGSHGGATGEGQKRVLAHLGITEASVGVPIKSSMETVELGVLPSGCPVHLDRNAWEADGIFVVNRVKVHTDFSGVHESGLAKMMSVGLGKRKGCAAIHAYGLEKSIPSAARMILGKIPILGALGILEDAADRVCRLEAAGPFGILELDRSLLALYKAHRPTLPADRIDLLVVREMGKNYSGTGMDTKVIGRIRARGVLEPEKPDIDKIAVLNLSKASYGNALGIGLADLTTRKLVEAIDYGAMYANTLPTTYLERAKIPMVCDNERSAIETGLEALGALPKQESRIVVVENTLELETAYVSKALFNGGGLKPHEAEDGVFAMAFDSKGDLFWRRVE